MSNIAITGSNTGTGTVSVTAPATNTNRTHTLPDQDGVVSVMSLSTAVTATGTSVDFVNGVGGVSIPATARRILVLFTGVSTNGASPVQVQLGSGVVQTTGYNGAAGLHVTGVIVQNHTTGFRTEPSEAAVTAASTRHGTFEMVNLGGNVWTVRCNFGHSNTNLVSYCGGSVTLTGTLDRIRITTVNGTDTFDAGSIAILVE